MGWMTLHSISVCYPDSPNEIDKVIVQEFMNAFGGSISCYICKSHFLTMFREYTHKVPSWNSSKQDLFLAICRMHNAVNKRLSKPYPKTVSECIASLKNATSYTSPRTFREKYIEYLEREWYNHRFSGDGHVGVTHAATLRKINTEYWNSHEVGYGDVSFPESDVLSFSNSVQPQNPSRPAFNLRKILGKPL